MKNIIPPPFSRILSTALCLLLLMPGLAHSQILDSTAPYVQVIKDYQLPEHKKFVERDWTTYVQKMDSIVDGDSFIDAGRNRLQLLIDGKEVISAVKPDIARAKQFIHLQVFIFTPDEIGQGLRDFLARKVQQGVKVRLLLDGVGTFFQHPIKSKKLVDSMRKAGIAVRVRRPALLHVDHRKVMVMDDGEGGIVGYTGGMNVGNEYQRDWHDQLVRLTGPAVTHMHKAFLDEWEKKTGERLEGFPQAEAAGDGSQCYIITHFGGRNADRHIKDAYIEAIKTARRMIRIEDPYLTDKEVIKALLEAANDPNRHKLKIQLIIPVKNDMRVTLNTVRSWYPKMLKAGIQIYEYQPVMEHLKMASIDDYWITVGTSNLDPQSMRYNNELNLIVLDEKFATEVGARIFDRDINKSKRIRQYKAKVIDKISAHVPFQ